jgi:hypothetical protein
MDWGANAIYDIVDGKLEFRSYFKLPAPQTEQENCVAHNGSVVPVPGRDLFVQAWYQGGMSVIDFTDSANPKEIAYFDRGPIHEELLVLGGYWSTYWYAGKVYGTEIVRGLDVFSLNPSDDISANELAAASLADQGELFNPQQQFVVTWPEGAPAVALSYVDQLARSEALSSAQIDLLSEVIGTAQASLDADRGDRATASELRDLAADLNGSNLSGVDQQRLIALKESLEALSERL